MTTAYTFDDLYQALQKLSERREKQYYHCAQSAMLSIAVETCKGS